MQLNHLQLSESTLLQYLKAFVETLPTQAAATCKVLFELLYEIASSPKSKTDCISIASAIAPLILRKSKMSGEKPVSEMGLDTLRRKYR